MEEKADRVLEEANAMNQLNTEPVEEASALEEKYASQNQSAAVDEELAKLKSKLGL